MFINISEHNRCEAIRDIYFTNMQARAVHMPAVRGRADCPVKNVYFTNCHFAQIARESIPGHEDGPTTERDDTLIPSFRHVENLVMQGTAFSVL